MHVLREMGFCGVSEREESENETGAFKKQWEMTGVGKSKCALFQGTTAAA